MCFVPQRRAIFRHLKFQKVVRHFQLKTCFPPQRRANFHVSAKQLYLRTRRFTEPTFRHSRPTNHWKNIRDFPNISHDSIFFLVTLLSSDSASLLCFSFVHIVGNSTSKLHSTNLKFNYMCYFSIVEEPSFRSVICGGGLKSHPRELWVFKTEKKIRSK